MRKLRKKKKKKELRKEEGAWLFLTFSDHLPNLNSIFLILFIVTSCVIFWRRQWQPTPVLLPGKSHGQRSLVGCSPWGHKESDRTERLHFHFSLSCTGEGNGNPLQCSWLENPRDGGAWWAAVSGVAQSWTRLKQLSSSSSSVIFVKFYLYFPVYLISGPHTFYWLAS